MHNRFLIHSPLVSQHKFLNTQQKNAAARSNARGASFCIVKLRAHRDRGLHRRPFVRVNGRSQLQPPRHCCR